MNDTLASLLPGGQPAPAAFPPDSRYSGVPIRSTTVDGREVRYLARRVVPQAESFVQVGEHVATDGQRPDTIAATYVGNAELWWGICDANKVL
jgi:hypothetical protein